MHRRRAVPGEPGISSAPSEAGALTWRRIGVRSIRPWLGMHIVRAPTATVDMDPVVTVPDAVEAHHDGAPSRLDAPAPPLLTPA